MNLTTVLLLRISCYFRSQRDCLPWPSFLTPTLAVRLWYRTSTFLPSRLLFKSTMNLYRPLGVMSRSTSYPLSRGEIEVVDKVSLIGLDSFTFCKILFYLFADYGWLELFRIRHPPRERMSSLFRGCFFVQYKLVRRL